MRTFCRHLGGLHELKLRVPPTRAERRAANREHGVCASATPRLLSERGSAGFDELSPVPSSWGVVRKGDALRVIQRRAPMNDDTDDPAKFAASPALWAEYERFAPPEPPRPIELQPGSDEWVLELAEIASGRFKRFVDCTRADLLAALELAIARHQVRNAVLRSLADHCRG